MDLPSLVPSPRKLYLASLEQVTKKKDIFTVSFKLTSLGNLKTPASSSPTRLHWKAWPHANFSPGNSDPAVVSHECSRMHSVLQLPCTPVLICGH